VAACEPSFFLSRLRRLRRGGRPALPSLLTFDLGLAYDALMGEGTGVGWESLALSFLSLGVVCLVAYGALKVLAGRGVGRAVGAVKVVARCPLEPRRSVYVIEAAGRCFLVGVGDGPMAVLAELDAGQVARDQPVAGPGFAEVLARVLRRPAAGTASPEPPEGT
jgi:flagellar biogenesis protein FliO